MDNVEDSFHVEEEIVICEADNAIVVDQDEKKDDGKFVLTNIFECVDNQLVVVGREKMKCTDMKCQFLLSKNEEMLFLKKTFLFDFIMCRLSKRRVV